MCIEEFVVSEMWVYSSSNLLSGLSERSPESWKMTTSTTEGNTRQVLLLSQALSLEGQEVHEQLVAKAAVGGV